MNNEEKGDPLQRKDIPPTGVVPRVKSVSVKKPQSFFGERPLPAIEMAPRLLRHQSRRDFLVLGAGALAALAGAGFLLPEDTLSRMGLHRNFDSPGKEWFLNRALRIDDDVAEALYSANRSVPTYSKSQITPLKNNYNGATPDSGYISGWKMTLDGLASGLSLSLDVRIVMPATVRSSRGSRLDRCRGLGERLQEGFKRFPILGEHIDELYPIPYLGIAGNHGGGNQDGGSDGKLQVQISPHCKGKQIFDVAAVQTQISSSATNRKTVPFSLYFKRHTYLYARGFATFVPMRLDALLRGVRIRRRHTLSLAWTNNC
jgi:hypothetical protein